MEWRESETKKILTKKLCPLGCWLIVVVYHGDSFSSMKMLNRDKNTSSSKNILREPDEKETSLLLEVDSRRDRNRGRVCSELSRHDGCGDNRTISFGYFLPLYLFIFIFIFEILVLFIQLFSATLKMSWNVLCCVFIATFQQQVL